jgi:hypothetical protein
MNERRYTGCLRVIMGAALFVILRVLARVLFGL